MTSECLLYAEPESSPEAELAHVISGINEDMTCATWERGIEFLVWKWVLEKPTEPFAPVCAGFDVYPDDIDRARALSEQINGWVYWREHVIAELDDDEVGVRFVPMDEWLRMYAEHQRGRG